jgi:hypothetical protein
MLIEAVAAEGRHLAGLGWQASSVPIFAIGSYGKLAARRPSQAGSLTSV